MSDLGDWFRSIPLITRYWFAGSIAVPLIGKLGLVSPVYLFLWPDAFINRFQVRAALPVPACLAAPAPYGSPVRGALGILGVVVSGWPGCGAGGCGAGGCPPSPGLRGRVGRESRTEAALRSDPDHLGREAGPAFLLNRYEACQLGPAFSQCCAPAGPGPPTEVTQTAVPGLAGAPG